MNTQGRQKEPLQCTAPTRPLMARVKQQSRAPHSTLSGGLVVAKVKGFPWWPARLLPSSSGKQLVYFFGSKLHGLVGKGACLPLKQAWDKLDTAPSRQHALDAALDEARATLTSPAEQIEFDRWRGARKAKASVVGRQRDTTSIPLKASSAANARCLLDATSTPPRSEDERGLSFMQCQEATMADDTALNSAEREHLRFMLAKKRALLALKAAAPVHGEVLHDASFACSAPAPACTVPASDFKLSDDFNDQAAMEFCKNETSQALEASFALVEQEELRGVQDTDTLLPLNAYSSSLSALAKHLGAPR